MPLPKLLSIAAVIAASLSSSLNAQTAPSPMRPDPEMRNPVAAHKSLWMEQLNWLEIRDLIRAGKTTAIVGSGGLEMSGPYLVAGKHNYLLTATLPAIASRLGNALIAPIVPFVPEGDFDPPTDHMHFAGSFSVSQATFRALLSDIARSLRLHGFTDIIFVADSGGNQAGMREVAATLTAEWAGTAKPARVHYIGAYYENHPAFKGWGKTQGIDEGKPVHHDTVVCEAMLLTLNPDYVRMHERVAAGLFSLHGVSLDPVEKTLALGHKAIDYIADLTAHEITAAIAKP